MLNYNDRYFIGSERTLGFHSRGKIKDADGKVF